MFELWGLRPQIPVPPAAGALLPNSQTPICLRGLGAPPPDPQKAPTLQISGYAPVRHKCTNKDLQLGFQSLVEKQANYSY